MDKYQGTKTEARIDWQTLAKEVADGAVMPPETLLSAVGEAAGGLPQHCTATDALRATADVYRTLGELNG